MAWASARTSCGAACSSIGVEVVRRASFDQAAHARQRREAGADAGPHDHRHQRDQRRQRQRGVDQDLPRQLFAAALLRATCTSIVCVARRRRSRGTAPPRARASRRALGADLAVVEIGLAQRGLGRWPGGGGSLRLPRMNSPGGELTM